MSYCLNPDCSNPYNSDQGKFCISCGFSLLLKERYRAIKPIGTGGMGRTFLGIDEYILSKPHCAIKQLYLQYPNHGNLEKAVELFKQEGIRLDNLGKHPQIPQFLAYFEQDEQLYLLQEFIEGQTLTQEIIKKGLYLEQQIWQLLEDLLPVLQFIHKNRVIHRDIKPDNIIRRKNDGKMILIDFGVARLFTHTAMIGAATIIGTPEYMAPEQTRGKVLPASDLYSLGVTCIYLLTGISTLEMFDVINEQWKWRDYLPSDTNISSALGKILDRLLQPSLRLRYQSGTKVLADIKTTKLATNKLQPNHQLTPTVQENKLDLSVEINYTQLQNLLLKTQWKQADEETWSILCQLIGKPIGVYLFNNDIEQLPCEHLQIIDQLWLKYSQGRFGFSVQQRIFADVEGEYDLFCDRIGWQVHRSGGSDVGFNFSERSPIGHLPSRRWIGGYAWWRHAQILANKLKKCGIVDILPDVNARGFQSIQTTKAE